MSGETVDTGGGLTILLVEDDLLLQEYVAEVLERAGHSVIRADDAGKAIAIAEERRPDLALLDIELANGTDGIEAARALRERWGIYSIFLSANLKGETFQRALRTGPLTILRKPCDSREILRALSFAADAMKSPPVD